MNLNEYKKQVSIGSNALAEIVAKTEIKTYGQFFHVWYSHLSNQLEATQSGSKEPSLPGEPDTKQSWDRFMAAWDYAMAAVDENEDYFESYVVDAFYEIRSSTADDLKLTECNCTYWDHDPSTAESFGLSRTYEIVDMSHDHRSLFECKKCGTAYSWWWHESSWVYGEEVTMRANRISTEFKEFLIKLSKRTDLSDHEKETEICKWISNELSASSKDN